ncbi:MAG: hypothetical protein R3F49_24910 [Planctomycetota bacterium]
MLAARRLLQRPAPWAIATCSALVLQLVIVFFWHENGLRRESSVGERATYVLERWPWPMLDGGSFAFTERAPATDSVRLDGYVWCGAPGRATWRLVHPGGVTVRLAGVDVLRRAPPKAARGAPLVREEFDVAWTEPAPRLELIVAGGFTRIGGTAPFLVQLEERGPLGNWRPLPTARLFPVEPDRSLARRAQLVGVVRGASAVAFVLALCGLIGTWLGRRWRVSKGEVVLVSLTALVAFAVRAIVLDERAANDPTFWHTSLSTDDYVMMSRSTLSGTSTLRGSYFSPGNTWWLMTLASMFGPALWMLRVANVVLAALSAGAVAAATARLAGLRVAAIAGALVALYAPLAFYQTTLHIAAVGSAITGFLAFALIVLASGTWRHAAAAGALVGFAALTRPTALVLVPVFALVAACVAARSLSVRVGRVAALFIGLTLVVAPQTALNYSSPFPSLITNSGGGNLLIGNNRDATGGFATPDAFKAGIAWTAESGESITRAALREIELEPLRALELLAAKVGRFVGADEGRAVLNYEVHGLGASALLRGLSLQGWIGMPLLVLLAGAGALLMVARGVPRVWSWRALVACIVLSATATVVFFVEGRIRAPILPMLVMPAACALDALFRLRMRVLAPVAAASASLLVLALASARYLPLPRVLPVRPASAQALQVPLNAGVALVGVEDAGSNARRGGYLHVTLYWQRSAARPAPEGSPGDPNVQHDARAVLTLVDGATGRTVQTRALIPGTVGYPKRPSSTWRPGQVYAESIFLRLDRGAPEQLELRVSPAAPKGAPAPAESDDATRSPGALVAHWQVHEDAVDRRVFAAERK